MAKTTVEMTLFTDAELALEITPKAMPDLYVLIAYYAPDGRWAVKGWNFNIPDLEAESKRLATGWVHHRIYRIKGEDK